MFLSYKEPTGDANFPVPNLRNVTVTMTAQDCVGAYTFYKAQYTIPGDLAYASRIDVISGSDISGLSDAFNSAGDLGGSCQTFQNPPPSSLCATGPVSTSPGSSSTPSLAGSISSSSTVSASFASSTSSATVSSTTSPSVGPVETLHHRQAIGGYRLVGCQEEATNSRALTGASYAYDGMTLETCMGNCTGFYYWGTEYGRECKLLRGMDGLLRRVPLVIGWLADRLSFPIRLLRQLACHNEREC